MHFRVSHRDKAERAIITALRSAGASVYPVNGKDLPDLLCGFRGVTTLLEVKTKGLETTDKRNGKTYTRTTETSKGQKKFLETWRGGPAAVVHEPVEALMMIGCPFVAEMEGPRWLALNGAFLCEGCWVPENGLHDTKCPRRTSLKVPGKVKSAYRAAKEARDVLPKKSVDTCVMAGCSAPVKGGYFCATHDDMSPSPSHVAEDRTKAEAMAEPSRAAAVEHSTHKYVAPMEGDFLAAAIDLRGVEGELQSLRQCACCHAPTVHGKEGRGSCWAPECPCMEFTAPPASHPAIARPSMPKNLPAAEK